MNFFVTVLGSGSALPTASRHCSAQVVNINGFRILLDCGEATQTQIRVFHQRLQSIGQIFLTHLHGDHFFGLPGLVSSMHLCGRTEPLDIYAPAGIRLAMDTLLAAAGSHIGYEIRYHELDFAEGCQLLFENNRCRVSAFPLVHSVPTYGYLVEEVPRGTANKIRRYAYCTDTAYTEDIIPYIHGASLLCMESTFDDAFASVAAEKLHSTSRQAATMALKAEARQLILTHISARFKDPAKLLAQAQEVFPDTLLAADGQRYEVSFGNIVSKKEP